MAGASASYYDVLAVDDYGFPTQNPTPTLSAVNLPNPDQTQHAGFLASIEDFGSTVVQAAENAVSTGYKAAKTVGGDALGAVEGVVSFGTTQVVLLLGVAAVVIYVAGKAGVFKALAANA